MIAEGLLVSMGHLFVPMVSHTVAVPTRAILAQAILEPFLFELCCRSTQESDDALCLAKDGHLSQLLPDGIRSSEVHVPKQHQVSSGDLLLLGGSMVGSGQL